MKREDFIALLSALLVLQGYLTGNSTPSLLGFGVALYLMSLRLGVKLSVEGSRELKDTRTEEGKEVEVKLTLKNLGDDTLARIFDGCEGLRISQSPEVFLRAGEVRETFYSLLPEFKGEFTLPPARVVAEDPRGLYFEEFSVGKEERVYVYPSVDSIKEAARADYNIRLAELYKRSQFAGTDSVEIKELREYQHGDDFKRIDWKASTRLGELIVREMMKESEADVYIFVDNTSEMRKGIKRAKIDYASTLALQLATTLIKKYRVGMVIYDEEKAEFIKASTSMAQLETMRRKLNIRFKEGEMSLRPRLNLKMSEKARKFIGTLLPFKKGRRGSKGIFEGLSLIKQPSFLIFISDLNNPSDLYKAIAQAKWNHRALLLTPNPILFYGGELDRETVKRLYRAYIEREKLLKKFSALVPTIDLGPSDYIRELSKVI